MERYFQRKLPIDNSSNPSSSSARAIPIELDEILTIVICIDSFSMNYEWKYYISVFQYIFFLKKF